MAPKQLKCWKTMLAPSFIPYTEKSPSELYLHHLKATLQGGLQWWRSSDTLVWAVFACWKKRNTSPIPYEIRLFIFETDKTGHTPSQTARYDLLEKLIPYPKSELWDQVRQSASCRSHTADAGSNHPWVLCLCWVKPVHRKKQLLVTSPSSGHRKSHSCTQCKLCGVILIGFLWLTSPQVLLRTT